jgi:hypothetical protein
MKHVRMQSFSNALGSGLVVWLLTPLPDFRLDLLYCPPDQRLRVYVSDL